MAPPLPELLDELMEEILLRLPPDDPACLVSAAQVCNRWRRIISDLGFPRRHREFHRLPLLLGFHHNTYRAGYGSVPRFVPNVEAATSKPFSQQTLDGKRWWVADCRHGRVLVLQEKNDYLVWDPITGDQKELPKPAFPIEPHAVGVVLCAVADCDHRDCHGGPFRVIFLISIAGYQPVVVHVCVYSSETRAWSKPVSGQIAFGRDYGFGPTRGALIGDIYYHYKEPDIL